MSFYRRSPVNHPQVRITLFLKILLINVEYLSIDFFQSNWQRQPQPPQPPQPPKEERQNRFATAAASAGFVFVPRYATAAATATTTATTAIETTQYRSQRQGVGGFEVETIISRPLLDDCGDEERAYLQEFEQRVIDLIREFRRHCPYRHTIRWSIEYGNDNEHDFHILIKPRRSMVNQ
jgi:hypothetical protein